MSSSKIDSKDEIPGQKEDIRIDLIKNENNSIEILKSESIVSRDQKIHAHSEKQKSEMNENIGKMKVEIIDFYERVISDIDIHTERLLMTVPEALKTARDELLERIQHEKVKSLAALAEDSPVVQKKTEYYEQFIQLKEEYKNLNPTDEKKKEEIHFRLEDLKQKLQVLEEFLEDFKNRTLTFEEVDRSVYESLIGELVLDTDAHVDLDLIQNQSLSP